MVSPRSTRRKANVESEVTEPVTRRRQRARGTAEADKPWSPSRHTKEMAAADQDELAAEIETAHDPVEPIGDKINPWAPGVLPSVLVAADSARLENPRAAKTWKATLAMTVFLGAVAWFLQRVYTSYSQWLLHGDSGALMNTSLVYFGVPFFLTTIALEAIYTTLAGVDVDYRLNDTICSFSNGLLQQLFEVLLALVTESFGYILITGIPYYYIYEHYRLADLSGLGGFLLMLLARDFCYYWLHFALHRVAIFWVGHGVHHRPNSFNLTTNLYQGVWQRVVEIPFYAPLALFFSPELYLLIYPLEKIYGFCTHTQLLNQTYFYEWFLVTPSSHRTHHASNEVYIDRNYGEVFTIWDRLFGTHVDECELQVYGHVHARGTWNPLRCQIEVLEDIWEKTKTTPSLWKKLLCFVMPPGWDPVSGSEFPLVAGKQPYRERKYDCFLGWSMALYQLVHFVPTLAMGIYVMMYWRTMSSMDIWLWCGWLSASLGVLGMMSDRSTWTVPLELLRLLSIAPMLWLSEFPAERPPLALASLGFALLVSAVVVLMRQDEFAPESDEVRREKYWIPEVGREFQRRIDHELANRTRHASPVSVIPEKEPTRRRRSTSKSPSPKRAASSRASPKSPRRRTSAATTKN